MYQYDPDEITRETVAGALRRSAKLRALLESQRKIVEGQVSFEPLPGRLKAVVRKLATGHAAYELARSIMGEPTGLWCGPLALISPEQRERFEASHIPEHFGEIGSHQMQRMLVTQVAAVDQEGSEHSFTFLLNAWVEVQEGRYRYFAADLPPRGARSACDSRVSRR